MSRMKMWKTKNGQKIRIKDLDDSHLLNILKMLKRAHNQQLAAMYSMSDIFMGEQALWDLEKEIDCAEEKGPERLFEIYADLADEAERRNLGDFKSEILSE